MDKWLRNTTVVRIIALALGVLLWVVVHTDEQGKTTGNITSTAKNEETISNVLITPKGLDESSYYMKSIRPGEVTLKVRGTEYALSRVNTRTMQIQVNLDRVKEGDHVLPLKAVGFPSGVEVDIYPSHATVAIEQRQKREMPVTIHLSGKPARGFKEGIPIMNPNRVHVTGPTSLLDKMSSVGAEINIEGVKTAVTKEVKLAAYDAQGRELQVSIFPSVVDVEIPVSSPFKTIPIEIRLTGQTPQGYSVASFSQSVDRITVYGPQDVLDSLEFYDGIEIDLSNLKQDKQYSFDIPLKDNITFVDPKKVEVQIHIVPSSTKELKQVKVAISGQNDGTEAKVIAPDSGKVDLKVEGAPRILDSLKAEDVQAVVDVSNLPPGKHEVTLIVNLPPYVKRAGGEETTVIVEISGKSDTTTGNNDTEPPSTPVEQPVEPIPEGEEN